MIDLDRFRDVDLVIDKANDNFIAKQWTSTGDKSGRTLTVMITNEGAVGELVGATVSLLWTNKANGLTDETAFLLKDKDTSTFVIEYPSNMLTPSAVIAQIRVWHDGKVVATKPFEITVSGIAGQMAGVVKQQEFGLLTAVLADANKFRTDINNLSNNKVDKGGNEQVTMGMLAQPVKEAMTGGSVPVVGENSVNTSNYVDGSVTNNKLDLPNHHKLPLTSSFITGSLTNPQQTNVSRSVKLFNFNNNATIYCEGYLIGIWSDETSSYIYNFTNDKIDVKNNVSGYIYARRTDLGDLTANDIDYISRNLYVLNNETYVSPTDYDGLHLNVKYELGSFNATGNETTTTSRIRMINLLRVSKGDMFTINTNEHKINIALYDTNGVFIQLAFGSWLNINKYSFDDDYFVRLTVAKNDDSNISSGEINVISDLISFTLNNHYLSQNDSFNLPFYTAFAREIGDLGNVRMSTPNMEGKKGDVVYIKDITQHGYTVGYLNPDGTINYYHGGGFLNEQKLILEKSGLFRLRGKRNDDGVITDDDLLFANTNIEIVTNESFASMGMVSAMIKGETENSTVYVDGSVNVSGNGTQSSPFKTIQEGIDSQAETVLIKSGLYREKLVSTNTRNKLELLCIQETDFRYTRENQKHERQGVIIDGSETLTLTPENGLFSCSYTATSGSRLERVFITQTLEPINVGSRSVGYQVTLWKDTGDISTSVRLMPVLTLDECETTMDTFFYDGNKIYINVDTISNVEFKLIKDINILINIQNVKELNMLNVIGIHAYQQILMTRNVLKGDIRGCEFHRSALTDGTSNDYCNLDFYHCKATLNRNDGYNFHGFGECNLYDCEGHYNYDDGASHHDGCTGIIDGGEWSNNGKGGVSPAHGCMVDVRNIYSHHNAYGIYAVSGSDRKWRKVRHSNNVLVDNTSSDYIIGRTTVISHNNKYDTIVCQESPADNLVEY